MNSLSAQKFSETLHTSTSGNSPGNFPAAYYALLISLFVAAGSYSILPIWLYMGCLWANDPLRAIGSVFPVVAFAGSLAAWRRIGWSMNGTFWALPLLALSMLLARITTILIFALRVHQQNETVLHTGPVMFLYGVGAVLLFGGTRLLRASIAPLCLLLLIDPVPHSFNTAVDLPLQYLSAATARHFAHLIGLQPNGEQLRMMFSPNFGMMIVPGCNGVRGSITLGYLTLIFGYIRHLRWRNLTITTLASFFLGYVLNLLRLCVLVIYYRVGLSLPSIQKHGVGVDYTIGCTLFLFATLTVGIFIRWIEPVPPKKDDIEGTKNAVISLVTFRYATVVRAICFLVLALAFIVPNLGKGNSLHVTLPKEQAVLGSFPSQVGPYRLIRTYGERDENGLMRFAMADYSTTPDPSGTSSKLTLGLYVGLGTHLVAYSRFAQGIRPDWTGSFDAIDASEQQRLNVHFVTTLYDDSTRRQFNAESACYETGCSASLYPGTGSLFFSAPIFSDLVFASNGHRLPILLRREWPDIEGMPSTILRSQFDADARRFTEHLNLRALLHKDGTPI